MIGGIEKNSVLNVLKDDLGKVNDELFEAESAYHNPLNTPDGSSWGEISKRYHELCGMKKAIKRMIEQFS